MHRGTALTLGLALLAAGCRPGTTVPERPVVRLSGGPLASSLSQALALSAPGIRVEPVAAAPGLAPLDQLERGDADITLAFADNLYSAYVAPSATGTAGSSLRAITVLQPAPLLLLVRPESHITSVQDVRGHTARMNGEVPNFPFRHSWAVPLGLTGSDSGPMVNVTALSHLMLAAFGVHPDSIHNRPMSPGDALRELDKGTLDAVFTTVLGSADAVSAVTGHGIRLVPIEGPAVDRLRRQYAFVKPVSIPPGTYAGQPETLHTVGVDLVIVCRAGLDEQLVYTITKAYFDAAPRLQGGMPGQEPVDRERAPSTPIPLHEGAARYFRERELFP